MCPHQQVALCWYLSSISDSVFVLCSVSSPAGGAVLVFILHQWLCVCVVQCVLTSRWRCAGSYPPSVTLCLCCAVCPHQQVALCCYLSSISDSVFVLCSVSSPAGGAVLLFILHQWICVCVVQCVLTSRWRCAVSYPPSVTLCLCCAVCPHQQVALCWELSSISDSVFVLCSVSSPAGGAVLVVILHQWLCVCVVQCVLTSRWRCAGSYPPSVTLCLCCVVCPHQQVALCW